MSFWESLRRFFGLPEIRRRPARRAFSFDDETVELVHELARREQRPPDEVAQGLMTAALNQHTEAGENLRLWYGLTRREQQVTALICLGYTNRQIASRLAISEDTVKTHIANVQRKFGLHSKTDLRIALADWDFSEFDK
jgi:DNA-binding NarL/FixJ family response regulator